MTVVGSIIARLGSKRLPYKNLLPFDGKPLVINGIEKLLASPVIDHVVVSTESELIARLCRDYPEVTVLKRPEALAADNIPSVPVFQHIVEAVPCDIHVNYNINFPLCDEAVFPRAIEVAQEHGESLSVPFAVWAQTAACLRDYGDPWKITAHQFRETRIAPIDVHTEADLLEITRMAQGAEIGWEEASEVPPGTEPQNDVVADRAFFAV